MLFSKAKGKCLETTVTLSWRKWWCICIFLYLDSILYTISAVLLIQWSFVDNMTQLNGLPFCLHQLQSLHADVNNCNIKNGKNIYIYRERFYFLSVCYLLNTISGVLFNAFLSSYHFFPFYREKLRLKEVRLLSQDLTQLGRYKFEIIIKYIWFTYSFVN